jgi:diphthamide synthase subunit DPH2
LASTALEFSISKIQVMSSAQLKGQLHVYKDILKDAELAHKHRKDMATVAVQRELVLQAWEWEVARL